MKKLFLFLVMGIMLISMVSADFGIDNYLKVSEDVKTIEVWDKGLFLIGEDTKLVTATLETNLVENVGLGYKKVFQVKVNSHEDYSNLISDLDFYNVKDDMNPIQVEVDLKYQKYKQVNYPIEDCITTKDNLTEPICSMKDNYITVQDGWSDYINKNTLAGEEIIVSGWTNTEHGDLIEWIPTIARERIEVWAVWNATGGTITFDGNYTVHTFTSDGTFELTGSDIDVEILVVAGGGGGAGGAGGSSGGAGGAGGLIYDLSYNVSVGSYTVVVGAGGAAGAPATDDGSQGENSSFGDLVAIGGGGGGGYAAGRSGGDGGSGGGAPARGNPCDNAPGQGTVGQGFNGSCGTGATATAYGAGAGGGASEEGDPGDGTNGGDGGDGLEINITGSDIFYAGGGGGGRFNEGADSVGGQGGGGAGGYNNPVQGTANTGGGGGSTGTEAGAIGGSGIVIVRFLTRDDTTTPIITLNEPIDYFNTTIASITFNCSTEDDASDVVNLTLIIDGVLDFSVVNSTTNENLSLSHIKVLPEGYHNWTCNATDSEKNSAQVSERFFNISFVEPTVTLNEPVNNTNLTVSSISLNCTVGVTNTTLSNVSLLLNGAINQTNTSGFIGLYNFNIPKIQDGDYDWTCNATDGNNKQNSTGERSFLIHTIPSDLSIIAPRGEIFTLPPDGNLTLNWRIDEIGTNLSEHVMNCSYTYNGVTVDLNTSTCVETNITSFVYVNGINNLSMTTTDIFNFRTTNITDWSFLFFVNSETSSATTIEGKLEDFSINITLNGSLSSANMIYNSTSTNNATISTGDNIILAVEDFQIPDFPFAVNTTFYWEFILSNGTKLLSNNYTQEVLALTLDNCTTNTIEIFNLSLFDEGLKTPLIGTIEVYYEVLNTPNYDSIFNLSGKFENISTTLVCSNINLTGQDLAYSTEIKYYSDDYSAELYHIQKAELLGVRVDIGLYDLKSNDTTEFIVEYQKENLRIEGAIIQLQRKYISEDLFEVVEAPLTGNRGTAVVHIDLNTNKYRATVVKDGIVLDVFENVVFYCNNALGGECTQLLYAEFNPQNEVNIDILNDFAYSISEIGNETIDIIFSIPSGVPAEVNISVEQLDQFGNETICENSIISSAGSIQCTFSRTIGQSYLTLKISKAELLVATQNYVVYDDTSNDFKGNNLIIVFLLLLSAVGMAFSSPEWIIINGIGCMVFVGMLWLVNGISIVAGLGLLAYLVIAAVILIMKISKTEDQ